jgi:small subunit ribosomal protein S17
MTGSVVKKSSKNTISILVETLKRHPVYGKVYRVSKKYLVHDPKEEAVVGDKVIVASCRPISKMKRWRLVSKVTAQSKG